MLDCNDMGGFAMWKRIVRAVEKIQRTAVRAGTLQFARFLWPMHGAQVSFKVGESISLNPFATVYGRSMGRAANREMHRWRRLALLVWAIGMSIFFQSYGLALP